MKKLRHYATVTYWIPLTAHATFYDIAMPCRTDTATYYKSSLEQASVTCDICP